MRRVAALCTLLLMFGITASASPPQKEKQNQQATLRKEAKISMRQAEKIALQKEPGAIHSKELERENGKLIYSFDIRTKTGFHEVHIDAIKGKVVEDSIESKAAEAKERQQDAKHHDSSAAPNTPPPQK